MAIPKGETYEKLGAFYLGRVFDAKAREATDDLLLYDSKDLLTHGVCVGMTGSGKTGLCIGLLEEAAIDNIPALVIDPKGDLANLMLTFPNLAPEDFRPWIDVATAERKGQSADEFAAAQAELWKNGLASWGQDGERIARLKAAADFAVYTPGSEAGLPISILSSFTAPPQAVLEDNDLLQERVSSTVSSLLGLLGIDADPLRSREHILLANILDHTWRQGEGYDLGGLIRAIQTPPVTKIGVFDLETFFPGKDRLQLAMLLNNLLAAPGFQTWFSGQALEIDELLYTKAGKPRVSIFSIAHLSDAERMFFVSLLLNQTLAWMRQRPGSSSLQALLYMDEVFGFMPPVANPPSKTVMLTLLKQARAFGLGVMLATQNPMDLDYKGLSNTGTWFLGRLQTERDKARILDGLEGASGGGKFDRKAMEVLLSGLGQRVFLLYNVHEDGPVLFQTRWAMSYLRGPMTRVEIGQLMEGRKAQAAAEAKAEPDAEAASPRAVGPQAVERPIVPQGIRELFLPARRRGELAYEPHLLGSAKVHYVDSRKGIEHQEDLTLLLPVDAQALRLDWAEAKELGLADTDLERQPEAGISFGETAPMVLKKDNYGDWEKDLKDTLYRTRSLELLHSKLLGEVSQPGESERDFRIRLTNRMRELRDEETEKLRSKVAPKLQRLEDRIRTAEQRVDKEKEQAKEQKLNTVLSLGVTALGALFGRKTLSRTNISRAGTAVRGFARSSRESQDVGRAEENLEALLQQRQELEQEVQQEIDALAERLDVHNEELEAVQIRPRKTDITVHLVALAWAPFTSEGGRGVPAWE
jgi:DNA helicase HerA-like ATPase